MKKIKLKKKNDNNTTKKNSEKKFTWKTVLSILLIIAIGFVSLGLAFVLYIVISSPEFEQKKLYHQEPTVLYDVNGKEFARVGYEDSNILTFDELPEILIDAVVATEDSRFFQHNGLDLLRFVKASALQLIGKDYAGGASTLSMQVVKNTYTKGQNEENKIESFIRKFKDIYISVFKLEKNYTKEEIIEFYLNSQWFASTTNKNVSDGIVGVERASEHYFGKSAKDITLAEASLLAGMFQNPTRYNPYKNPEGCRNRQRTVLKLLKNHGYITEQQMNDVLEIPVSSLLVDNNSKPTTTTNPYQAFIDYVLEEVSNKLGYNAFSTPLEIYTTLDTSIQDIVSKVETGEVFKFPNDVVQESVAVTNSENGSIVAISGGRNYAAKGINRVNVRNQPGSTAKPLFDFAMYIQNISQSTYAMFLDEPTTYTNGQSISNYDNRHKGLITMRYALKDSRNVTALKAFKAVNKLEGTIIEDFVHSVGIDYGKDLFESASIGGFDGVSPLELSAAYATFARGGYYIEPYSYTKVVNTENNKEHIYSYAKEKVMEDSTAFMINDILNDIYSTPNVAGKTGTTNLDKTTREKYGLPSGSLIDIWYQTYSSKYSISLWYGYDKIEPDAGKNTYYLTSNTGGTARSQIMKYLANNIHKGIKAFDVPNSITTAKVELQTFPAQLCSEFTPTDLCVEEYFVKGTEPTDVSTRYSSLDNPTNGTFTFNGNSVTLKWDGINTPDAINPTYLNNHFSKYYENVSEKYYNERINYNNSAIGTLGYQIYLLDAAGNETYIGYTNNNSFNYNVTPGSNYTFLIKSAYSIFKNNMSSGLKINVSSNIDTNIGNIVGGGTNTPEDPTN